MDAQPTPYYATVPAFGRWGRRFGIMGVAILAYAALFAPNVTLAWLIIPLVIGITVADPRTKAVMMGVTLVWPIGVCSLGLINLGESAVVITVGAALLLGAIAALASVVGITMTTIGLLAIPIFPASPLLVLVALVQTLPYPLIGFGVVLLFALGIELRWLYRRSYPPAPSSSGHDRTMRPIYRVIMTAVGAFILLLSILKAQIAELQPLRVQPAGWFTVEQPLAITDYGSRLKLRDAIRERTYPNSLVILGETMMAAADTEAVAFWCEIVAANDITLLIGVSAGDRSTLWRLTAETCAQRRTTPMVFLQARLGVPSHTGPFWPAALYPDAPLTAHFGPGDPVTGRDVLLCIEAFLPWAWIKGPWRHALTSQRAPVVIVSNDRAFGRWAPAVRELRRKVARAMASLVLSHRRPPLVLHAETDHSFLIFDPGAFPAISSIEAK